MPKDSQAPATKQDIQLLMTALGKLYDANERWKDEIIGQTEKKMEAWKQELKNHFDLTVETIREDLPGANKDRIEDHEDRIVQLERHAGGRRAR